MTLDISCLFCYLDKGDYIMAYNTNEKPDEEDKNRVFFISVDKNGKFIISCCLDTEIVVSRDKNSVVTNVTILENKKTFPDMGKAAQYIGKKELSVQKIKNIVAYFNGENFDSWDVSYEEFADKLSRKMAERYVTDEKYKKHVNNNFLKEEEYDFYGRKNVRMDNVDVSPYKIVKELGRGRSGVVFVAEKDGKKYALKMPANIKSSMKVFRKEYDLLERAYKFGIAPKVYGFNEKKRYFVMEFLGNGNLVGKKLTDEIIERIAWIINRLDEAGINYRDFHEGNFMFGEDGQLYMVDFGMALDNDKKKGKARNVNMKGLMEKPFYREIVKIFPNFMSKNR